ncbi:hypothetical protein C5167_016558 [Papaver somniferum]|nr:hypothetical protein C5167_016558 [Papaver somniferum]
MLRDTSFLGDISSEIKNIQDTIPPNQEKENPTGTIYRPDVFLQTHKVTPDDNHSSSKSLAPAKLALEAYDKDPSAQKCLGTNDVTKFLASEFMKAKLQEEKQKNKAFKAQLDTERQKNTLEYMIGSLIALISRTLGS